MKTVISVLTAHFFVLSAFIWLASPACADSGSDYKAGSDFAKQVQGNGELLLLMPPGFSDWKLPFIR